MTMTCNQLSRLEYMTERLHLQHDPGFHKLFTRPLPDIFYLLLINNIHSHIMHIGYVNTTFVIQSVGFECFQLLY